MSESQIQADKIKAKENVKVLDFHRCSVSLRSNEGNLAKNIENKYTAVTPLYYLLFLCSKTKAIKTARKENLLTFHELGVNREV